MFPSSCLMASPLRHWGHRRSQLQTLLLPLAPPWSPASATAFGCNNRPTEKWDIVHSVYRAITRCSGVVSLPLSPLIQKACGAHLW